MTLEFKYFTKSILKEANEAAIREDREYVVDPTLVNSLPEAYKIPVLLDAIFIYGERRLILYISEEHPQVFLDVSELRFESLPVGFKFDDGSYKFETKDEIEKKRPYANGREWIESTVKRPLRKQAWFRANVLDAYGQCCALCDISEKSLLRAAHIVDVVNGGDDNVTNGICLCVNHEIAFDRGLIIINEDYSVVSKPDIGVKVAKLKTPYEMLNQPLKSNLEKKKVILGVIDN